MTKRAGVAGALFAGALMLAAQVEGTAGEDRWLPYEGCWRAEEAPAGTLLCVVAEGAGVRLVEIADGKVLRDSRVTADGAAHAISREGCTGFENARWSGDGQRVYLETTMTCGEQLQRKTSGMFALLSPNQWLSIHAIEVGKEAAVRSVKYEVVESAAGVPADIANALKANRLARETARTAASQELDLSDIVEAAGAVHGRAVEVLLMTRGQEFDLNGRKLVQLADAGLPAYLIDAVVAVSNPRKFAVRPAAPIEEEAPRNRSAYADRCDRYSWSDPWCDGSYYGYARYSPWGAYYSPYSYGYNYYRPPVIVIRDPDQDQPRRNRGRITRDGYRSGGGSTSGEPRSSVGTDKSGSSTTGSSTTTSTGGASSTSQDSGSSTRKAKPRGSGS